MSTILTMFLGWLLIESIGIIALKTVDHLRTKKTLKLIMPQIADPKKLCKGPHSWITASTFTATGPSLTQLCRVCGFISGSDKVVSVDTIDIIEKNNKIKEIEHKLMTNFLAQEDDNVKKHFDVEIKGGLDFNKLLQIHTAGMTFNERFVLYKQSKSEYIEKELTRNDA